MGRPKKQSKTTTLRLDEKVVEKLQQFSRDHLLDRSTVVNQILLRLEDVWTYLFSGQVSKKDETTDKDTLRSIIREELAAQTAGNRRKFSDRRKQQKPIQFDDRRRKPRRNT